MRLGQRLGAYAWALIAPEEDRYPAALIMARLAQIISGPGWEVLLDDAPDAAASALDLELFGRHGRLDREWSEDDRRAQGMYFTPPALAAQVVEALALEPETQGWIGDLSAGAGALLVASVNANPGCRHFGVERQPALALACALRLMMLRMLRGLSPVLDRVFCGDGLKMSHREAFEGPVVGLVGNPPYVGEKGNRALFEGLRQAHPDLAGYFGARQDLLYLFFHRGLDWLEPGGKLAYLSSAYWLQATGATSLRQDLLDRCASIEFVRFLGQPLFEDAPGHESLLTVVTRGQGPPRSGALTLKPGELIGEGCASTLEPCLLGPGEQPWRPFVDQVQRGWLEQWRTDCVALGQLVQDRQGFVSGADRLDKRRHAKLAGVKPAPKIGAPIFLFLEAQIPSSLVALKGTLLKPRLRGAALEANTIYREADSQEWALYVSGALRSPQLEIVEEHLAPFRALLMARREVSQGQIPWYRLHWPRDPQEQLGPKLVCPRRAKSPCFVLDLAGHVVSSDCTYLPAPAWSEAPILDLLLLMVVLNSPEAERALRLTGKLKGALLELYAQPLRAWPVPLMRRGERLALEPGFARTEAGRRILALVASLGAKNLLL